MAAFDWDALPRLAREKLLQGAAGPVHVHEAAHAVFEAVGETTLPARREALFALGCELLRHCWEAMPLEPSFAQTLLTLHGQKAFLAPSMAGLLRFCLRQEMPEGEEAARLELPRVRNLEQWQRHVQTAVRQGRFAMFAVGQAVGSGLREGQAGWVRRVVEDATELPKPFKAGFLADAAFADARYDEAERGYAQALTQLSLETWRLRRAEALYRAGDEAQAIALWRAAHEAAPWNVNTTLRLADVLAGRDKPGCFPPGQGAVLLYSWNKAEEIDATLASLADSELAAEGGEARVFVLDNGSADATPQVLEKWREHFAGRMEIVTLPVNVGAPAARNWLLALPEVKAAPWAAFLDDDVAVPRDWLRRLWDGVRHFPQAGVVSGHAVDYHAPMSQQWTDMHLIPLQRPEDRPNQIMRERFKFTSLHEQAPDFGEFWFMRPVVTAIGCCHLFTREALDASGGFDVRFSPSQSDDVDHDMRRGLAGHFPVCNGHVQIRHKRATGYHKTPNPRSWASAVGNWYKLQGSYTDDEVLRLFEQDQRTMLAGVRAGEAEVAAYFAESARSGMTVPASAAVSEVPKTGAKVGVVIPAYNYGHYLADALNSVLAQEGVRPDVVVVDDGSEDNTPAVLERYAGRVTAVRQSNAGLSAARNTGMATLFALWDAEGLTDFSTPLVVLDADDLLEPGMLASQAATLTRHTADLVVCRNRMVCGEPGKPVRTAPMLPWPLFGHFLGAHLCHCNIAPCHAWLFTRRVAEAVGGFDTTLRACEDHDYWLRCCAAGFLPVGNIESAGALYRRHETSMSAQSVNQVAHDATLHGRVADLLRTRPDLFPDSRTEAWLAHAAGCLVTSVKIFTQNSAESMVLVERARQALKSLAAGIALKKIRREPSPELDAMRDFYGLRVVGHLEALATGGPAPVREQAVAMRDILWRVFPHMQLHPHTLAHAERALMHKVYVDWPAER